MEKVKHIALIAHDNRKADLIDWVDYNKKLLAQHHLYGTGTTGSRIQQATDLPVKTFQSGPLGGDQQIGAAIAEYKIDVLIFFWDPLQSQPHDVDVKALLRIGVLYNIPVACNRSTADFIISSPLFEKSYEAQRINYQERLQGKS